MKSAVLSQDPKTYLLVFDPEDEVVGGLMTFIRERQITAGHFTAIGAVSRTTLGFFDRKTKEYARIPHDEQAEVLSLIGDVAVTETGEPGVHAHIVLGLPDGSAKGGHLMEAMVWPTLEVVLTESPKHLRRTFRPELGLALIDLK